MVGFFRLILFLVFFVPGLLQGQAQLYEKEHVIRIKFNGSYINEIKPSTFSRTSEGYVKTGLSSLDALNEQFGALELRRVFSDGGKYRERREKFGLHLWYEVRFDASKASSVQKLLNNYSGCIAIQQAEPLYSKHRGGISGLPFLSKPVANFSDGTGQNYTTNDPRLVEQWHYNNTTQTGGTSGADIKLLSAWDLQKGSSDVVISIHDGGIDVDHTDIADNMWINLAELNGTPGIDDDGNGYIDDIYGYNLADNTGNILADDHGTHVAGTVAAVNNNNIGVAGVAGGSGSGDGARLMSCQVFGNSIGGFAESYAYAADNGAVISQNSWGYTYSGYYEQVVLDAIDYFIANAGFDENGNPVGPMQGGIVIFAAGNSNSSAAYYPGYYEPVLSVASTNHNDQKSYYSNYGSWVDVSAPGGETAVTNQGILSTLPNNNYGFFQGTSMACPHVSGVAALIVSQFGGAGFTPAQLRFRLTETTDDIDDVNSSFSGQLGTGRINAFAALLQDDGIAPDQIADLVASELRHDQATVSWTAPADEDNNSASSYEIRYSLSPITEANFESAILAGSLAAQSQGSMETYTFENLSPHTSYYFAIRSRDYFSNISAISNVLNVTTTGVPVMEVAPLSLTSNLYVGESEVQQISISNTGEGVLEYILELGSTSFSKAMTVLQQSAVFKGLDTPHDKSIKPVTNEALSAGQFERVDLQQVIGSIQQSSDIDLQIVLDSLNNSHSTITALIPDYYSFSEGETGYEIWDGGNDMYDGGNKLATDVGGYINYHDKAITTSTYLNNEHYFTAKYPGLFVLATDLNEQSYFEITGNLGADGSGSVDGAVLSLVKNGKSYLGFVKRVYDAWDPSVNHLIIVEDNGSVNHEFSTNTNDDYHRINGLTGIDRMYYLLFAGTSGSYIDNDVMLGVMDRFVSISTGTRGVFLEEHSGTVEAGETKAVDILFDAAGLEPGQYNSNIFITSNASDETTTVATELNVEGAPHITSNFTNLDFGNVFINQSAQLSLYLKNTGNEDLEITDISVDDSAYVTSVGSGAVVPGDSLLVNIDFSPVSTGSIGADLMIRSNDPNNDPYQIRLIGNGVEPPVINVNPISLTEALYTGGTSSQIITISNSGNSELYVVNSIDYAEVSGSSVFTLSEKMVKAKDPDSDKQIEIFAQRLEATLTDLTGINVGVFGYGDYSILIQDISARGASVTELFFPLSDMTAYDIVIVNDYIYYASVSDLDMLIDFVDRGGNLIMEADDHDSQTNINYVIAQTSSVFNSLSNYYNDYFTDLAVHPITSNISGIYSFSYGGYYSGSSNEIVKDNDGNGHVVVEKLGAGKFVLMANELMINGAIYDEDNRLFANQVVDWLAGNIYSWLTVDPQSSQIASQSSSSFSIHFDATGLVGGIYNAEINVDSNDPVTPRITIPVTLEVTGIPLMELSLSEMALDDTYIGQERTDSLFIFNNGTETLHISNINSSHAEFIASSNTLDIEMGEGQWLKISFNPTTAAEIVGTLTFESDDPTNATVTISLSGLGMEPPQVTLSPSEIFESLVVGESSTRDISIFNSGNGELQYEMYVSYGAEASSGARQTDVPAVGYFADMSRYQSAKSDAAQLGIGDTLNVNNNFIERSTGMAYVDGFLYVISYITNELVKFDPVTLTEVSRFGIHLYPYSITWDGTYLWIGDYVGNVYAYDRNGTQHGSFSCPFEYYPTIAWDGDHLIISKAFSYKSTIYELDVTGTISDTFHSSYGGYIYSSVYVDSHNGGTFWAIDFEHLGRIIHYALEDQEMTVMEEITVNSNYIPAYSIAHNGSNLLLATWDGTISEIDDGVVEASWLKLSSDIGNIGPASSGTNSVSIDAAELEAGEYSAIIHFISNDPEKPKIKIPVSLNVCEAASASPPEIELPVDDQVIDPDDGKVLIDMEGVFSSSAELTYGFYTNNPTLAQIDLYGPILAINPVQLGEMVVTVYAFDSDCGRTEDSFKVSIEEITAIEDEITGADIKIYPNPMGSSGGVIEFISKKHGDVDITLLDINGREVQKLYSGEISSGVNLIEISNGVQSGFYLVKITMDEQSNLLRLMVK
ncbi:hypothetical protein C900_02497 [Fulvivirga imtechensis AK7]|uniref:Fibronectin type-III domain-containing protein n=1 Tax=Fulvivirga imtechensis AK7 TaxID=1237149 RepID=L8JWJ0_9BACT|nr:S8 family serine peptidase [Fulvivirga imtechensis]ELR71582.1 hypothetical protein C900_02497 [Fulvivirga imtechensis AK7]